MYTEHRRYDLISPGRIEVKVVTIRDRDTLLSRVLEQDAEPRKI